MNSDDINEIMMIHGDIVDAFDSDRAVIVCFRDGFEQIYESQYEKTEDDDMWVYRTQADCVTADI